MGRLMRQIVPTTVAVGAGVLVLLGYLFPHPLLAAVRDELVRWAVVLAAFAFILGFFNLLRVHLARTRTREGIYSLVLILAALASLGLTSAALFLSPLRSLGDWWFRYVLSPLQATVAGLVALVLAVAVVRMVRRRREWGVLVFLLTVLIVLLGTRPLSFPFADRLADLRAWWMNVPVVAGARGLLIGVGLGTLLVGLRVLIGSDRPYSD